MHHQQTSATTAATGITVYDPHYLNLTLNRIYDLPEVVIDAERPKTINVLVPAFEFKSISAGFFGVFQVARFWRNTGWNVRLVMFDNFYWDQAQFKTKFLEYPGMENLLDELEIEYIGERKGPLRVSPNDICMATVWYSAYFAEKIMKTIAGGKAPGKFIYLIQDYETNFFAGSSLFALADQSYEMNFAAVFSSKALQNFFISNDIGGIVSRKLGHIHFNNACEAQLGTRERFVEESRARTRRKLVFYSRPVVNRNMFELTALVLATAFKEGIFDPKEWDCIGMGLGDGVVELLPGVRSQSLARMTLKEYKEAVSQFDICLTLMASAHPSLIPMDLGGSGALVVTNTFHTKTPEYLTGISNNIIPCKPNLHALVEGLRQARERVANHEQRYDDAIAMNYPRSWDESLTQQHIDFFRAEFEPAPKSVVRKETKAAAVRQKDKVAVPKKVAAKRSKSPAEKTARPKKA